MAARIKITELKTFFAPLLEKGILSKPEFLKFCTGSVAENIDPQGWIDYEICGNVYWASEVVIYHLSVVFIGKMVLTRVLGQLKQQWRWGGQNLERKSILKPAFQERRARASRGSTPFVLSYSWSSWYMPQLFFIVSYSTSPKSGSEAPPWADTIHPRSWQR